LESCRRQLETVQGQGELTDDDLARMDGKREQFEGVLQERYGEGRDRIREEVDTWLKTLNS
jgi:uncharacterized protein YjbJ (UPF0337 family)